MTPVFLIAGPGLIGVHDLGRRRRRSAILSGAVGFSAAAILGLAWAPAAADGPGSDPFGAYTLPP